MTTQPINESGMTFGPYPEGQCFYIEKSDCYRGLGEGVKMAEFLLLRQQKEGPTVWVVEAKSSCPREDGSYIDEIRAKLTNALMLGLAARLGRHPKATVELPDDFKKLELKTVNFRLVLVIKGEVPESHLVGLKAKLGAVLSPVIKTWAMSPNPVVVLNQRLAQKYGLILPAERVA
jgi:hypothetical protein